MMLHADIRRRRILARLSPFDVKLRTGLTEERLSQIEQGIGPPLSDEEAQHLKDLDLYPRPIVRG
jgi:transcriptional regulator with XRE-family HTH domain